MSNPVKTAMDIQTLSSSIVTVQQRDSEHAEPQRLPSIERQRSKRSKTLLYQVRRYYLDPYNLFVKTASNLYFAWRLNKKETHLSWLN